MQSIAPSHLRPEANDSSCWLQHGSLTTPFQEDKGVSENRGYPKMDGLMENPIEMDDLGVPLFSETPI